MDKEEKMLSDYENKLNDLYARANTKSKKKRILYDLFNFSAICREHFGIEKVFDWEQDEELIKLLDDFVTPFIDNVLDKRNSFFDISKSVIDTFIDVKYPFYEDYHKLLYSISPLELQEIMFDFLNSYDPKLQCFYKKMLEDCEIFEAYLYASTGYSGLHYPMDGLKKNFIFCETFSNSIFTTSLLIHEIGHAYESDLMYQCGINGYGTIKEKLPYTEVSSKFFEYAFLNYLKENRIYVNDTRVCLLKYYKTLLQHMYHMNLICKTKYLDINKYGYVEINDVELVEYANRLKDELNYFNLSSEIGEEMHFKNSFVYGIGGLFSIYLYDRYQEDSNGFKKDFRNMLINYPYNENVFFEVMGITEEELVEGNVLKKVLNNI